MHLLLLVVVTVETLVLHSIERVVDAFTSSWVRGGSSKAPQATSQGLEHSWRAFHGQSSPVRHRLMVFLLLFEELVERLPRSLFVIPLDRNSRYVEFIPVAFVVLAVPVKVAV